MRQEDKEVDGPELEHAEERKRHTELVEEREDEVYDLDGQPESFYEREHDSAVIEAMRQILAGDQLVINDLDLSKRHLVALEALKTAVEGKDTNLSRFVYAEDRRTLLEQSLAVLQPELASLDHLGKPFEDLLKGVGELREALNTLEDAEEELVEGRVLLGTKSEGDTGDKPDQTDDDDDKSLTGPERKIAKPASELTGPERKPEPKPASALTGPEPKVEPKGPTTLGDPAEIFADDRRRSGDS